MERQRKRERGQNLTGEIEERGWKHMEISRADMKGLDRMIDRGKAREERDRRLKIQRGKRGGEKHWRNT
jgi:hypothetical protein